MAGHSLWFDCYLIFNNNNTLNCTCRAKNHIIRRCEMLSYNALSRLTMTPQPNERLRLIDRLMSYLDCLDIPLEFPATSQLPGIACHSDPYQSVTASSHSLISCSRVPA